MIISHCPLRVSLFGGSTDNPYFVEKYGYGSVISFTCDLKTYITLHEDKIGYNHNQNKYIINYSKREETEFIEEINNEVVRGVLSHFDTLPLTVSMTSDVYSQGSGLASSSSYIINLINCISISRGLNMTEIEICALAYKLEREFNPYCGYQDPYGCGVGGFKRIEFRDGGKINYEFLNTDFFRQYDAHLIFTGVTRNSKNVLKDVTSNIDKAHPLLKTVDEAHNALSDENYDLFLNLLSKSWTQKKETSSVITENPTIKLIDEYLENDKNVLSHKLCGAGNGGFFLTFSKKDTLNISYDSVKINVSTEGVLGSKL
jgi:D-glycero-alpha-D-manno-heptose-7-phosphate kinase